MKKQKTIFDKHREEIAKRNKKMPKQNPNAAEKIAAEVEEVNKELLAALEACMNYTSSWTPVGKMVGTKEIEQAIAAIANAKKQQV